MKRKLTAVTKKSGAPARKISRTGSTVADFLAEEGLLHDAEATAIKRVIAWELTASMKAKNLTKQQLAKRMATSRSQLDRLLDPENPAVQLDTVARAARALGKKLELRLVG